jgi:lipopolysaccharide transport system ATP-binding protein
MSVAIKVEHVSKQYRLGLVGSGTMRDDMERWWYRMRGKEDPTLKLGETNDRSKAGESDYVWALRDINFEVQQGEVLGIIGKNGAGKSTLLKLLSRVTAPTIGHIKAKGRIASLLEVGTGFHPELTGKENIFLNGAIMGMKKHEIARKLDEIVDFAGVERYLETPVKRYSSGMYVRLAFAVAAHLEPEILIVDEVLAVGDAEFQKKCMGKMQSVSAGEGKTILFVSHNMAFVKNLCKDCIHLKNGTVQAIGTAEEMVNLYLNEQMHNTSSNRTGGTSLYLRSLNMRSKDEKEIDTPVLGEPLIFDLKYQIHAELKNTTFAVCFNDSAGKRVVSYWTEFIGQRFDLQPGSISIRIEVEKFKLTPGVYEIVIYAGAENRPLEQLNNFKKVTVGLDSSMEIIPLETQGIFIDSFTSSLT